MESRFDWVPFFEELAKKLAQYRNNQGDLIRVLREAGVEKGLEDQSPKDKTVPLTEIDPFTFFALVIKYKKFGERTARFESIKKQLAISAAAPKSFDGVPSSDPRNSWFFSYKYGRDAHDIDRLWSLFNEALSGTIKNDTLQQAMEVKQAGKAKLTQAMFWVAPNHLLPVDSQTRPFLKALDIQSDFATAADYMSICNDAIQKTGKPPYAISHDAYEMNQSKTDLPPEEPDAPANQSKQPRRSSQDFSLNVILYGPPGTGKTYAAKALAVEICDGSIKATRPEVLDRYEQLRSVNRIEFATFHQSFSYEDFVEGLRPALNDDGDEGDLKYECRPGVFKRICTAAEAALTSGSAVSGEFTMGNRRLFKMSLGDTYRPEQASIYPECIENGYLLLGYGKAMDFTGCKTSSDIMARLKEVDPDIKPNDYNITSVYYLIAEMHVGDLVLVSDGNSKFRAIGEVTGDYEYVDRKGKDTFCQKRNVRWLRQFEESQPIDLIFEKRLSQMTVYLMDQTSIKRAALEARLSVQRQTTLVGLHAEQFGKLPSCLEQALQLINQGLHSIHRHLVRRYQSPEQFRLSRVVAIA